MSNKRWKQISGKSVQKYIQKEACLEKNCYVQSTESQLASLFQNLEFEQFFLQ